MTQDTLADPVSAESTAVAAAVAKLIEQAVKRLPIPVSEIYVGAYNPRTVIDYDYIAELAESIKAQGILQAPLVRPITVDGVVRYELVYGQCRFLAFKVAYGDDSVIEVDVRELTDEQAALASLTENVQRQDPTPADEARAAARVLGYCSGDREEAARKLGWKPALLNARLKLMACSERVLERFGRVGSIGLAELFGALTKPEQDKLLDQIEAEGKTPTVDELRVRIQALSKGLQAAIFDKSDCATCHHNTGRQREMFATALEDGHCTNATCFDEKTEAELQNRAAALQDTWQVVRILRPGERLTVAKLVAEGPNCVGPKQAESCKACGNYGALVSGTAEALGKTIGSVCFDPKCNADKVTAYKNELGDLKRKQEGDQTGAAADNRSKAQQVVNATKSATDKGKATTGKADGRTSAGEVAAPTITLGNVVYEYRDQLYRTVLLKEFSTSLDRTQALLLALAAESRLSAIDSNIVSNLLNKHGSEAKGSFGLSKRFNQAMGLDAAIRTKGAAAVSAYAIAQLTRNELTELMNCIEVDWNTHFTLGEDFLAKLTKSEIVAVAQQLRIVDKLAGETFKSLLTLKKAELITKVLGVEGFTYQGAIPKVLKPDFKSKA